MCGDSVFRKTGCDIIYILVIILLYNMFLLCSVCFNLKRGGT